MITATRSWTNRGKLALAGSDSCGRVACYHSRPKRTVMPRLGRRTLGVGHTRRPRVVRRAGRWPAGRPDERVAPRRIIMPTCWR